MKRGSMVYKRYIKKKVNGKIKVFGPYYYESYRDKQGIARTKYVNKPKKTFIPRAVNEKNLLILILVGIFASLFIVLFTFNQISDDYSYNFDINSKVNNFNDKAKVFYSEMVVPVINEFSHFITGLVPQEDKRNEEKEQKQDEDETKTIESKETEQEKKEVIDEPKEIKEPELNETIPEQDIAIVNETTSNISSLNETSINITTTNGTSSNITETNITTTNETISNITKQNITIINETITNITLANESILNITVINETITNVTIGNLSINTIQYSAVIGKPVKWKKQIISEIPISVSVELPKQADNINVFKLTEDIKGKITEDKINIITGKSIKEDNFSKSIILNFFKKIFNVIIGKVTGKAVDIIETQEVKEVTINENATEFEIEYETPAPAAFEADISNGKEIIISGPEEIHYENVLAFTELPREIPINSLHTIKLYHVIEETINITDAQSVNNEITASATGQVISSSVNELNQITNIIKTPVNFDSYDTNNNSLIDYIEWLVPSLSNQTYELIITVLNVQSYPTVGGNWTVVFNTSGTANLTISTINTTYSELYLDNNLTIDDLTLLELKCGNSILFNKDNLIENDNFYLIDENNQLIKLNETINKKIKVNSLFVENYNCDNLIGYHTVKVLTPREHTQLFNFGDQNATAHNWAKAGNAYNCSNCSDCTSAIINASSGDIVYLNSTITNQDGNCINFNGTDNIIFDCQGYAINGDNDGNGGGILLPNVNGGSNNNTIKNCNITDFNRGFDLSNTDNNNFFNITSSSNARSGFYMLSSNYNNFTLITTESNRLYGIHISSSDDNNFTNIIASSSTNNYGMYIINSNNNNIINLTALSNDEYGLYLDNAKNNIIIDSTLKENNQYDLVVISDFSVQCNNKFINLTGSGDRPIEYYNYSANIENKILSELVLCNADNSNLTNITLIGSDTLFNNALYLVMADNVKISNVNSTNNYNGVYLFNSNSNILNNLTLINNSQYGLKIFLNSDSNIVTNSTIKHNSLGGIDINEDGSNNPEYNLIYNNFLNNTANIILETSIINPNYLNTSLDCIIPNIINGNCIGGNYYANLSVPGYSQNCTDNNEPYGICDNVYNLSVGTSVAYDYLPLTDNKYFPSITLNAPANASIQTNPVNFNWTASDAISTTLTCNLTIDSIVNASNILSNNGTTTNKTVTGFSEASHLWNVTCWGNDTNTNTSATNTFTINTTPPNITINSPLNQTYSTTIILFNITTIDISGVSACLYTLNNGVNNYTMSNSTASVWNATNSTMAQGSHTARFYCNDTNNNMNNSETKTFVVDTIYPIVTLISPADAYSSTSTSVTFQHNVTEVSSANCSLILDGAIINFNSSVNISGGTNTFTNTTSVGSHTWSINCTDSANNIANSSSRSFTITSAETTTPSGGGGGGGGGIAPQKTTYDFSIDKDFLPIQIKKGEHLSEYLTINNKGVANLSINIIIISLNKYILPEKDVLFIETGKSEPIRFDVYVSENEKQDVYTGRILFSHPKINKSINVALDVKDKLPLFDISTTLLKKYIFPGQKIFADISILNLGDLKNIDVDLEYKIIDFENKTYDSKKEAFAINDSAEKRVFLEVPRDTLQGSYLFYSKVSYGNISASSYDVLSVVKYGFYMFIFIAGIIFVLILIVFFVIIKIINAKEKNAKNSLEKNL